MFGEKSMASFAKMSYMANPRKNLGLRVRSVNQIQLDHLVYFLSGSTDRTVETIMKNFPCINEMYSQPNGVKVEYDDLYMEIFG